MDYGWQKKSTDNKYVFFCIIHHSLIVVLFYVFLEVPVLEREREREREREDHSKVILKSLFSFVSVSLCVFWHC